MFFVSYWKDLCLFGSIPPPTVLHIVFLFMVGFACEGERQNKFGLQEQRHLRGSVQGRCAEVCAGVWCYLGLIQSQTWVGMLQTRLFPGLLFTCCQASPLFSALLLLFTQISSTEFLLIYLFIYLLYSLNRGACLWSEHRCAREGVALRAWDKVWVFWGCLCFV